MPWIEAAGAWFQEIGELVQAGVRDTAGLATLGLLQADGEEALQEAESRCFATWDFTCRLLQARIKSLVQSQHCPPCSMAPCLSTNAIIAAEAMQRCRQQWVWLLRSETLAREQGWDPNLLQTIQWQLQPLNRLLYMCFERGGWDHMHADSRRLLRAVFQVQPDSKVIEDLHQHLRDEERARRSDVRSIVSYMSATISSGVLEQRGLQHCKPPAGSPQAPGSASAEPRAPAATSARGACSVAGHRLHADWARILHDRQWASTPPEGLFTATAAWMWLQHWWRSSLGQAGVQWGDGWLSALLGFMALCQHRGQRMWVVLAEGPWGALGWQVEALPGRDEFMVLCAGEGALQWLHVHDVEEWCIIPYKPKAQCCPCHQLSA